MSTAAERELRGLVRAIGRNGCAAIDSYEDPCCFYCRAPRWGRATKHAAGCLYVRAKDLLRKYPARKEGADAAA